MLIKAKFRYICYQYMQRYNGCTIFYFKVKFYNHQNNLLPVNNVGVNL